MKLPPAVGLRKPLEREFIQHAAIGVLVAGDMAPRLLVRLRMTVQERSYMTGSSALSTSFESALDEYLAFCGKVPEKLHVPDPNSSLCAPKEAQRQVVVVVESHAQQAETLESQERQPPSAHPRRGALVKHKASIEKVTEWV